MSEPTHDLFSERLEAYVSGRLDQRAHREVDDHLATCPDCSLELAAVQALREPEVLAMSGTERDALNTAVRAAVFAAPKPSFMDRFGRRFAPAVGAVALLALAAVVLVSLPERSGEPAGLPGTNTGGGGGAEPQGADTADAARGAAPPVAEDAKGSDDGTTTAGGAASGGAAATQESADAVAANAGTTLSARADFTVEEIPFSTTGLKVGSLVPAISPKARLGASDGGAIAANAPTERLAELARDCAELTVSTSPHPLVPTSAAYYPDDVLVIGFVWLEESSSLLNYELRGWVGGRCDRISPIYRRGFVE